MKSNKPTMKDLQKSFENLKQRVSDLEREVKLNEGIMVNIGSKYENEKIALLSKLISVLKEGL